MALQIALLAWHIEQHSIKFLYKQTGHVIALYDSPYGVNSRDYSCHGLGDKFGPHGLADVDRPVQLVADAGILLC